ncbi:hypothetical protein OUZ56_016109 [Daphnia magna]|uniref:Uncharacterized protein n=1 Tax=Daphnia magna TaxID=35525 RepID=A0ABR0APP3_9CRUS|nr:hypothetical protein OUZ56_016109 [Daphnia magna]
MIFEDGANIEFFLKMPKKLVKDHQTSSDCHDSSYRCGSRSLTKAAVIRYMNNIDKFERHLDVLNEVLNSDNDSDANEDELYEKRIEVRRRMVPFYRQRADIFDIFDDNKIYKS